VSEAPARNPHPPSLHAPSAGAPEIVNVEHAQRSEHERR
jgi:hypothetical protein